MAAGALTACSAGSDGGSAAPARAAHATATGGTDAAAGNAGSAAPSATGAPGASVAKVRDSFAVLQATYNDSCDAGGDCEYFLTRVLSNLDDLYDSMKADPAGPAHFDKPIAWIDQMHTTLGSDESFTNLKAHEALLTGTRDNINTWMQSHLEDYR